MAARSHPHDGESGGQPHDALFRLVLGQPEHAASELRSVLPADLVDLLDLEAMQPVHATFVDPSLRRRHADALFTTRWRGRPAYLYLLLEHQSTPDPLMALRMAAYQVRIWEAHQREHPHATRLPLIIPVVLYQGRASWSAPTDLGALIDVGPSEAAPAGEWLPRMRYRLDAVAQSAVPDLRQRPLSPAALITLVVLTVAPGSDDVTHDLDALTDEFRDLLRQPGGLDVFTGVLTYLWKVSDTPPHRLRRFATHAEEAAVTTAQKLHAEGEAQGRAEGEAQGRAEGEAQGRAEGRAALLTEMLTTRFGPLDDPTRQRLSNATTEQITRWSTRLINGASTLDDVLS
jgi:predicted transposase YdaD